MEEIFVRRNSFVKRVLSIATVSALAVSLSACAGGAGGQEEAVSAADGSLGAYEDTLVCNMGRSTIANPKFPEGDSYEDNAYTRYLKEKQIGRFIFKKTDKSVYLNEQGNPSFWSIYKKKFKTEFLDDEENNDETLLKKEILSDYLDKFPTSEGTKDLNVLGLDFEYPKPVSLIKYLVEIVENGKKTIVLDFFAGSGTTGQAVMELNEEDGGNRQFILVTNNENGIGEKITRERLYRVINGQGSKGEKIAWKYSEDKPYLSNNSVRVFKIENTELKLNDLEKAEKLKEQAKLEFKKLNPNAEFSNDFDIYNELSALNPIKK